MLCCPPTTWVSSPHCSSSPISSSRSTSCSTFWWQACSISSKVDLKRRPMIVLRSESNRLRKSWTVTEAQKVVDTWASKNASCSSISSLTWIYLMGTKKTPKFSMISLIIYQVNSLMKRSQRHWFLHSLLTPTSYVFGAKGKLTSRAKRRKKLKKQK